MNTPAGLKRFTRSMVTRFAGKCAFCGEATVPGVDYAALSQGKWLAVCLPCTVSIGAQVRGKVRTLQAASAGLDAAALAPIAAVLPDHDALASAMAEDANEAHAYDVLLKLDAALVLLVSAKPVAADPLLDALRGVADNAAASPRDREFAASLAQGLARYGKLTERQAPHAERLIARYASGSTTAVAAPSADEGLYIHDDGTVRKVYMTRNDRLACKVLTVTPAGTCVECPTNEVGTINPVECEHASRYDHYDAKGSFQYETGGRRIVADALAAGTARLMTQDEAAAFGRQYSFCCNCAKYLDDDRSLAAGYGPTCAANLGWHYPSYDEAAIVLGRPVTRK